MHKTYLIYHGPDAHIFFGSWTPFKCIDWHSHPLNKTESLVTMRLREGLGIENLLELEAAGTITLFPNLAFGISIDDHNPHIAKHPDLQKIGVKGSHRTYDVGLLLHKALGWPPFHPER